MTPEEAVVGRVLQLTAVTAIVGSRVYLDKLPQNATMPAVRVTLVDEGTDYHLRGGSRDHARVQVDAYAREVSGADTYAAAIELADAIHGDDAGSGLSGWVGEIGSPAMRITGILRIDRTRDYDPDEVRMLRQRQDYRVYFNK